MKNSNAFSKSRRERTQEKANTLRNLGYKLVTMWECRWKKERARSNEERNQSMTEKEILEKVLNNEIYGMIQCDIEADDDMLAYFSEMSPIFKTSSVGINDIGEHMAAHLNHEGKSKRLLIGGTKAKGILIATPLLRFYIKHGMTISNVQVCIEYEPSRCFATFADEVTRSRRAADVNPETQILADTNKLIGNSAYGVVLMRNDKHRTTKYVDNDHDLSAEFNKKSFCRFEMIDEKLFEIQHAKSRVVHHLPLQIGFFILQFAKLRLLEFYYDFLDHYIARCDYQMICCDTDSAYITLSDRSLRAVVKPELLCEFDMSLNQHCSAEYEYKPTLENPNKYLQRICCGKHTKEDARTPGLFKIECQGEGIVALCSKTYCVKSDKPKFSCKGINKASLYTDTVYNLYKNVLFSKISASAVNHGIRMLNNRMVSYEQKRYGFRYAYWKRKLQDDGVSTLPLDIWL